MTSLAIMDLIDAFAFVFARSLAAFNFVAFHHHSHFTSVFAFTTSLQMSQLLSALFSRAVDVYNYCS